MNTRWPRQTDKADRIEWADIGLCEIYCVTDSKTYSDIIYRTKVKRKTKDLARLMGACVPTYLAEDEKVEQCYDDVERAMADTNKRHQIITKNFDATLGDKREEQIFKTLGSV